MQLHARAVHVICRQKLIGVGTHYGVLVEFAEPNIAPECWELNDGGLRCMTLGEFAKRRRVVREVSRTDPRAVNAAIHRLRRAANNPRLRYDWLQRNCEHWAREIVQGERHSSQISGLLGVGGLALLVYMLSAR